MQPISGYLDSSGRDDVLSGGARRRPVGPPAIAPRGSPQEYARLWKRRCPRSLIDFLRSL